MFYTDDQKTIFSVGDKVSIVHTGEFSLDDIPVGTKLSPISIIDSAKGKQ